MAICRLGSDAYRGGRSEPRRFGQSASWSTALTIWPFTVRVGHTDWPLAGVMRAGQHFPRHRRRQRNPSRIKAGWAAATVAQANMRRTVFMLTSPGLSRELQNFPFLAGYDVGDMIGPDGQ
jgi:hypothetical protein